MFEPGSAAAEMDGTAAGGLNGGAGCGADEAC